MANASPNLILAGPTGVGKSSAGRSLAARLGMEFLDFDSEIEKSFAMTVAEIFGRHGERVFRAAEADLCRLMASRSGVVAATGGGAVVPAENRAALARGGVLICLRCDLDELLRRLRLHGGLGTRPLLRQDPEGSLRRILEERRVVYDAIPLQVDTTRLTLPEVTEAVAAIYAAATAGRSSSPNGRSAG